MSERKTPRTRQCRCGKHKPVLFNGMCLNCISARIRIEHAKKQARRSR
jgi:hypothetical protein